MRMSEIADALEAAANTIYEIRADERRRLVVAGTEAAKADLAILLKKGTVVPVEPGFMSDMPTLAEMAGKENGVEVIVGAGMLMLAGEIRRLHALNEGDLG